MLSSSTENYIYSLKQWILLKSINKLMNIFEPWKVVHNYGQVMHHIKTSWHTLTTFFNWWAWIGAMLLESRPWPKTFITLCRFVVAMGISPKPPTWWLGRWNARLDEHRSSLTRTFDPRWCRHSTCGVYKRVEVELSRNVICERMQ